MTDARGEAGDAAAPRPAAGRRRRAPSRRPHRVEFSLSDAEFAAVRDAAGLAGMSLGAFAALAAVSAARGDSGGAGRQEARKALAVLVRCAGQQRKIGANFNQAVAKLHATGRAGKLEQYAEESIRIGESLDEAAARLLRAVR